MPESHNAHVFVVDKNTFIVHRNFLFCGVVNPSSTKERYGVYSDLMNLREGDLIFFYVRFDKRERQVGFNGVYKTKSKPFFDTTEIRDPQTEKFVKGKCSCGYSYSPKRENQFSPAKCLGCGEIINYPILPNRVLIELSEYYMDSIKDNTAYVDHRDYSTLWTMLFRKVTGPGRAKSIAHILPEEANKILRLLKKTNSINGTSFNNYPTDNLNQIDLKISDYIESDGSINPETVLHAWIMKNLDKDVDVLKDIVGSLDELEYFGAFVPYSVGTDAVDILILHKKKGIRYKATVIELKRDKINKSSIDQISRYSPWIAQLVTENAEPEIDVLEIQPVVIGFGKTRTVIMPPEQNIETPYYSSSKSGNRSPKNIKIKVPILLSYKVTDNKIQFNYL